MKIEVLALDLEATLVDNALQATPRPGLRSFLEFCHARFPRVVLFTTVEESDAREVVTDLVSNGFWPEELADRLEYVQWTGQFKDLRFVQNAEVRTTILVDDDAGWIHPDQQDQWLPIPAWHGEPDSHLMDLQDLLNAKLS